MQAREERSKWAILAALVAGGAIFVGVVRQHDPVGEWLFWTYAGIWLLSAAWALSCLAGGHLLLSRPLGIRLPLREHLLSAFAAGVLLFATGLFLAGILGLLGSVFFCGWPLILLAAGGPALVADLRKRSRRARLVPVRGPRLSWPNLLVLLFGLAGVVLLYLQILTPANVSYDARWYHLGVAEQYVVEGRITRFDEGWFQGTLPQLASWLYTWALLVPGESAFFEVELAAHLEFTLFLATLAGLPVLVRWLTRRRGHRGSWAAVFLFPGIFLYDSNLNVGAEHVLAFWAVPIALALARFQRNPDPKGGVLLGIMLAGAMLTKYQAVYFLPGVIGLLVYGLIRRRRTRAALPAILVVAASVLGLTSTHWLKNWLWYENPLYPFLHGFFGGAPWAEGVRVGIEDPGWRPTGTLFEKTAESFAAIFSFSFDVHDWERFHGDVPVFGSLFTLLLLPLLFLRRTGRIRGLAVATLAGVFVWYWTYHQDRYLQALLPWMAAVTAATIILLWRSRSVAVRWTAGLLIALQIVWGGDVPFIPTHAMIGETPYGPVLRLLSSGYRDAEDERREIGSPAAHLKPSLDPEGTHLLHEQHMRLGIGRRLVVDGRGRQGAIVYETLGEPRAVHERLRSLGVTHVVWADRPQGLQRMTDDLVFYEYVRRYTDWTGSGYRVFALPEDPPSPASRTRRVTVVGCRDLITLEWEQVESGWKSAGPGDCDAPPSWSGRLDEATATSAFVIVDVDFRPLRTHLLSNGWRLLFEREGSVAFARG